MPAGARAALGAGTEPPPPSRPGPPQDGTAYSGDYEKDNTGRNACGFGDLADKWEKCECPSPAVMYRASRRRLLRDGGDQITHAAAARRRWLRFTRYAPTALSPAADYCALPSNMFENGHCGRCVRVCGADSCVVVSGDERVFCLLRLSLHTAVC